MNHVVAAAIAAAVLVGASPAGVRPASARTQATLSYHYDKVWPAVVRFLRIDERLRVTEKDLEAGYVLFELEEDGATFIGSVELARVRDQEGRDASRVVIHIEDRPAYMEQGLIDRLRLKLRRELGVPKEPPPPAPAPTPEPKPSPDKRPGNDRPSDKPGDDNDDDEKRAARRGVGPSRDTSSLGPTVEQAVE